MTFTPPDPIKDLKWLAVDLDGTIARTVVDEDGNHSTDIGEPFSRQLAKLDAAADLGWKIIIHTSRPWAHYQIIEAWLRHHNVPYSRIVCGKLLAHRYIDDRAVAAEADDWVPHISVDSTREMQSGRWQG